MTPALTAELRHAVTIVRHAVAGPHSADPTAIASAHSTLEQRRPHTRDRVRDAIDHYLDDNTWRQGPHVLRHAALTLAAELGVPLEAPSTTDLEQLRLFEAP